MRLKKCSIAIVLIICTCVYADDHINIEVSRQQNSSRSAPTQAEIEEAIQAANQKEAAAKLNAQRSADQAKLKQAQEQLDRAKAHNQQELKSLNSSVTNLETQLGTAKQKKSVNEQALKDYERTSTAIFKTDEQKAIEQAIADADKSIEEIDAQLKNVRSAIDTRTQDHQRIETRLQQDVALANSEYRTRETTRRTGELIPLITDYETQLEQIRAGRIVFDEKDIMMDGAIAQAEASGNTALVTGLKKDQKKMREAYDEWIDNQFDELSAHNKRLQAQFEQNRVDGVGPTNTGELRTQFRDEAKKRGIAIPPGGIEFIDEVAVANTTSSALKIATGAPGHQDANISIWTELSTDSVGALVGEMWKDVSDGTTFTEFFPRFGYFLYGFGDGAVQIAKDLFKLVGDAADLTAESIEQLLNKLFNTESNLFGREQSKAFAETLYELGQIDKGKFEEILKLQADRFDRELEKTAGMGKEGERKATAAAGRVTAEAVGVEGVAAAQIVDKVRKARRLLTGTDKALDAATDAAKVAKVDCPGRTMTRTSRAISRSRAGAVKNSNMAPGHADAISDVAVKRDEVLIFRPVNPHSTDLIRQNYATKSMHIKGKSSDWGAHAGMIPVEARYSKLGGPGKTPTPEELAKYDAYNQKSIKEGYAIPVEAKGPDGKPIIMDDGNPLMVLGDPATGKPITADYDLLGVASKKDPGKILNDKDLGTIAEREVDTVNAINKGVNEAGHQGGNVAHHGAANRFEKTLPHDGNFPMTAMTPDGNVHEIKNIDELSDFVKTWEKEGYKMDIPEGWNINRDVVPSGKFARRGTNGQISPEERALAGALLLASKQGKECPDPDCATCTVDFDDETIELDEATPTEKEVSRATTGTSGSGGDDSNLIAIGGSVGAFQAPPAIFSFGGIGLPSATDTSYISPDGKSDLAIFFGPLFDIKLQQVFPIAGNNPFSLNPISEDSDSMNSGGGSGSSGSNPYAAFTGPYSGDFGCGVSFTTLGVMGSSIATLNIPSNGVVNFNINMSSGNATSQSNNLFILGAPGHTCSILNPTSSGFSLNCTNSGGGSCSESFVP